MSADCRNTRSRLPGRVHVAVPSHVNVAVGGLAQGMGGLLALAVGAWLGARRPGWPRMWPLSAGRAASTAQAGPQCATAPRMGR